jgi:hypothetical protein
MYLIHAMLAGGRHLSWQSQFGNVHQNGISGGLMYSEVIA